MIIFRFTQKIYIMKTVYQIFVISASRKNYKFALSIYEDEELANSIAEEMNIDFTRDGIADIAIVETRYFFKK